MPVPLPNFDFDEKLLQQGQEISLKLDRLRREKFPPDAKKSLRTFTMSEVSYFLGVTPGYLKKLDLQARGPKPQLGGGGRRYYSAEQMQELRVFLDRSRRGSSKPYLVHRQASEKLQVIAVVNFKGGSGKTTTAAHLAQYLALRGHRVLAVDLDPQGSLSALYGYQPEFDGNRSMYDAIRYDGKRVPLADILAPTNFLGLDVVPANLELQEFEYDTPIAMQSGTDGKRFYMRFGGALKEVQDRYDIVVVDCPPHLGYLTLSAMTAATAVLVTVHPQMLDLMSMSQFLQMLGSLARTVKSAGGDLSMDWLRYLITRYEPTDIPQSQMLAFMQSMLADDILPVQMLKSTAISDAGLTKQTLYEIDRAAFGRETYDRAIASVNGVNGAILDLVHAAWGRA
ncbi:plasmid partitioning protein RepA [Devosia elaeis]|uniref:Plasmid partitioning protein RepA n=1 Tax=Devosia elaeis TaxID=1770058 RepID=A0A178HNK5_9HYPH|nr:plasmid partitioning protein RepA [Devosia elaeis]OAM74433.1 plasmid partitioning protein RepA [Devosia elaeis]